MRRNAMGMRQVESKILAEAKVITGNKKLRLKDIMEWSTGEIRKRDGENIYYLPETGVNVSVKVPVK
jgi:hypothetical protein